MKKAYLLLDALHGPKESDVDMLSELSKTGLAHQLVLTKLDRAPATVWTELSAALRRNPVRVEFYNSAVRTLQNSNSSTTKSMEELKMGVWAPLRGQLALGCDETILGISSHEEWGIGSLRCSILKACGAFKQDDQYLRALQEAPIVEQAPQLESPAFDDNPMRGEVFGGKETIRKRIHRW